MTRATRALEKIKQVFYLLIQDVSEALWQAQQCLKDTLESAVQIVDRGGCMDMSKYLEPH